jgi:hypothetical protein
VKHHSLARPGYILDQETTAIRFTPIAGTSLREVMNPNSIDAGLLRFCLEHSDGGNLTETQLPQRDEADYKWLRAALNDLQTDADRMKKLVEMLKSSESSETDKTTALEELQYLIEDLDNANGTRFTLTPFYSFKFTFKLF